VSIYLQVSETPKLRLTGYQATALLVEVSPYSMMPRSRWEIAGAQMFGLVQSSW